MSSRNDGPSFHWRAAEWVLCGYFGLVACVAPFFTGRPAVGWRPALIWITVCGILLALAAGERFGNARAFQIARDWTPLALLLAAFREMDLFTPLTYSRNLEQSWVKWDHLILHDWNLSGAIDALAPLSNNFLELCYLLVYGTGLFCVALLYLLKRSRRVPRWNLIYLAGTLPAYALLPYFPSRPPRILFPDADPVGLASPIRELNLYILRHATIHVGVFPSAHVSSVFAAAFGTLLVLPEHKAIGRGLLAYAICVSVATVYGRYHYAVDAVAGFGVSLVAAAVAYGLRNREQPRW